MNIYKNMSMKSLINQIEAKINKLVCSPVIVSHADIICTLKLTENDTKLQKTTDNYT